MTIKKCFTLLSALALLSSSLFADEIPEPKLRIDNINREKTLPATFRSSNDRVKQNFNKFPSKVGFKDLHISGSGQFSERGLLEILKRADTQNFAVIDLREESHAFVNGIPLSWHILREHRQERTVVEIQSDEQKRLDEISHQSSITAYELDRQDGGKSYKEEFSLILPVEHTCTEQQLIEKHRGRYLRLGAKDWDALDPKLIDEYIDFVDSLPEGTWLHVHCMQGRIRTTLFMVIYDIHRNAKQVPLDDILKRHAQLGGIDLSEYSSSSVKKSWYDTISKFYDYCRTSDRSEPFSQTSS